MYLSRGISSLSRSYRPKSTGPASTRPPQSQTGFRNAKAASKHQTKGKGQRATSGPAHPPIELCRMYNDAFLLLLRSFHSMNQPDMNSPDPKPCAAAATRPMRHGPVAKTGTQVPQVPAARAPAVCTHGTPLRDAPCEPAADLARPESGERSTCDVPTAVQTCAAPEGTPSSASSRGRVGRNTCSAATRRVCPSCAAVHGGCDDPSGGYGCHKTFAIANSACLLTMGSWDLMRASRALSPVVCLPR